MVGGAEGVGPAFAGGYYRVQQEMPIPSAPPGLSGEEQPGLRGIEESYQLIEGASAEGLLKPQNPVVQAGAFFGEALFLRLPAVLAGVALFFLAKATALALGGFTCAASGFVIATMPLWALLFTDVHRGVFELGVMGVEAGAFVGNQFSGVSGKLMAYAFDGSAEGFVEFSKEADKACAVISGIGGFAVGFASGIAVDTTAGFGYLFCCCSH